MIEDNVRRKTILVSREDTPIRRAEQDNLHAIARSAHAFSKQLVANFVPQSHDSTVQTETVCFGTALVLQAKTYGYSYSEETDAILFKREKVGL